jgi:hypothetical protein
VPVIKIGIHQEMFGDLRFVDQMSFALGRRTSLRSLPIRRRLFVVALLAERAGIFDVAADPDRAFFADAAFSRLAAHEADFRIPNFFAVLETEELQSPTISLRPSINCLAHSLARRVRARRSSLSRIASWTAWLRLGKTRSATKTVKSLK